MEKMVEGNLNFFILNNVNEVSTTHGSEGSNDDVKKNSAAVGANNVRLNRM
jgi:hypothetical protein